MWGRRRSGGGRKIKTYGPHNELDGAIISEKIQSQLECILIFIINIYLVVYYYSFFRDSVRSFFRLGLCMLISELGFTVK